MKKILPIAAALVLALAGCSSPQQKTEESAEEPAAVEETAAEDEATEEETPEVAIDESSEDQGLIIDWTDAATADEAAKGAGFDKFGVIDRFVIGDLVFENPTFAYAGGVAQATYETPATMITVRKGVDTYTTPLSDRELDEFAAHWHKVLEGTDVTCYGQAKGAVTVATWTDGIKSYGLTFQGLGGEEMSMDSDELATIVKGFNEANADQKVEEKKEEPKAEEKKEETTNKSSLISAADAEALVEKDSKGTCTSIDLVTTKEYGQCWYAIAVDSEGTTFEYYVTNNGVTLISKTAAQKKPEPAEQKKDGEDHYEGEPVTIYDSIYAEWHKANDQWYATFITYNNTQIFAQPAPAGGGWVFWALSNGQQVQVIYSDQESSVTGEVGPAGVSSHWIALDGSAWF